MASEPDLSPSELFKRSQAYTQNLHVDVYPEIDPTNPLNSQANKVVVITGASRGLGRQSFARSFAQAGPRAMVLVARSKESLAVVVDEVRTINPTVDVMTIGADLSDNQSLLCMWSEIEKRYGHADVLINNAGTFRAKQKIIDVDMDEWWSNFEINVRGTLMCTRLFLRLLGKHNNGVVVNLTSAAAVTIYPTQSSYHLSKLLGLAMQAWIAAENPNVVAVALNPGVVATDMLQDKFAFLADDKPELTGAFCVWLATKNASFLNGKYTSVHWDVVELMERQEEIKNGKDLSIDLVGRFGCRLQQTVES